MKRTDPDLGTCEGTDRVKNLGGVLLGRLVAGGKHGQDIGKGADLGRLVQEGGGLDPGIFAVILPVGVFGDGFLFIGMAGPLTVIP